jgi:hypothetical protein
LFGLWSSFVVVILQPIRLRWIQGEDDDPKDLCAHGDIDFRIGQDVLVDDSNGKDLTVSAAALYLLRSLSTPHTEETCSGENLFPCCGHSMWDIPGKEDVTITGCPLGVDFEIRHEPNGETFVIRADDGREWSVPRSEWREAVFYFADRVSDFYASCLPKQPTKDDAPGFDKFLQEWERRRGLPLGRTKHCT